MKKFFFVLYIIGANLVVVALAAVPILLVSALVAIMLAIMIGPQSHCLSFFISSGIVLSLYLIDRHFDYLSITFAEWWIKKIF